MSEEIKDAFLTLELRSMISYLREGRRLRVFENRILRRIFGPNRDGNGEWRRLHNGELHNLYL